MEISKIKASIPKLVDVTTPYILSRIEKRDLYIEINNLIEEDK